MSTRIRLLCALVALAMAEVAFADGPGVWTGACGELDEDMICPNHGLTAICTCDSMGINCTAYFCCGRGYHETINRPITWTGLPLPCPAIWSDPAPCGWRWACRTTIDGIDGEFCLTAPGCSFSGTEEDDKRFSTTNHPNLSLKAICEYASPMNSKEP